MFPAGCLYQNLLPLLYISYCLILVSLFLYWRKLAAKWILYVSSILCILIVLGRTYLAVTATEKLTDYHQLSTALKEADLAQIDSLFQQGLSKEFTLFEVSLIGLATIHTNEDDFSDVLQILLKNGVRINRFSGGCNLNLSFSTSKSTSVYMKTLLENKAQLSKDGCLGFEVIDATKSGSIEVLKYLFDEYQIEGRQEVSETLLHNAIESERLGVVEFLLLKGFSPSVENSEGHTGLQAAHKRGFSDAVILMENYQKSLRGDLKTIQ